MEETFINIAKKNFSPDEARTNLSPKLMKIREEYERKFDELVEWFWEEIGKQTTNEEKRLLNKQLDEN